MTNPNDLVKENLPKGSTRLLVTIVLSAIIAVSGVYYNLTKDVTDYDRKLYAQCLEDLERCNEKRDEEYRHYVETIMHYSKEIEYIKKQINITSKSRK
ncbi:MAG: hypothetical protein HOP11_11135 [Saprospiraceae bacterium]|nr:hypothetical protein [Saprospiraceae bacterium]